jgi:hypothetical protein
LLHRCFRYKKTIRRRRKDTNAYDDSPIIRLITMPKCITEVGWIEHLITCYRQLDHDSVSNDATVRTRFPQEDLIPALEFTCIPIHQPVDALLMDVGTHIKALWVPL